MKNEEIVRALRCVSTVGGEHDCEHCPYWTAEEVPEEFQPMFGTGTWYSCDVDRVGLDGAALIEKLADRCARYAEEIAVAQERTRWIPVEEKLPDHHEHDYVLVCVTEKTEKIDYRNAVTMAFLDGEHFIDVETDCILEGVTHWMPLPAGPEVE